MRITDSISIDEAELEEKFIRSPGSGGQKVNKTETAVQLRFNARKSLVINHAVFLRLQKIAGSRMTQNGEIVITAHQFRTQELNREDARARLIKMIAQAVIPPKRRRKTKPTLASKRRRLDGKKRTSELKKGRGKVRF